MSASGITRFSPEKADQTMPWRDGHDLSSFDPDTVAALSAALDQAWNCVRGSVPIAEVDARTAREQLAVSIINDAKMGERDPEKLAAAAASRFAR
jgi:hypothetical protein